MPPPSCSIETDFQYWKKIETKTSLAQRLPNILVQNRMFLSVLKTVKIMSVPTA